MRYLDNKFNSLHDVTIGVEFGSRMIHVKDKILKIHAWDTAGQECFKSITKSYYRNASAIVVVFDVTNENSFNNLDNWMKDVYEMTYDPVVILVGNKTDLESHRKIPREVASQYASDNGMYYREVSAKDQKDKIDDIFEIIAKEILTKIENGQIDCLKGIHGVSQGPRSGIHNPMINYTSDVYYPKPKNKCC